MCFYDRKWCVSLCENVWYRSTLCLSSIRGYGTASARSQHILVVGNGVSVCVKMSDTGWHHIDALSGSLTQLQHGGSVFLWSEMVHQFVSKYLKQAETVLKPHRRIWHTFKTMLSFVRGAGDQKWCISLFSGWLTQLQHSVSMFLWSEIVQFVPGCLTYVDTVLKLYQGMWHSLNAMFSCVRRADTASTRF